MNFNVNVNAINFNVNINAAYLSCLWIIKMFIWDFIASEIPIFLFEKKGLYVANATGQRFPKLWEAKFTSGLKKHP